MRVCSVRRADAVSRHSSGSSLAEATSSIACMLASGVRSSWDASETKCSRRSVAAWMRASIRFIVSASRWSSSCAGGVGTRCDRSPAPMVAAFRRIRSTGASARPTLSHVTRPVRASTSGKIATMSRVVSPTARFAVRSDWATTTVRGASSVPAGIASTR
nr:hypothetical protein DA06_14775 [Georgenia sp. SUBG003]